MSSRHCSGLPFFPEPKLPSAGLGSIDSTSTGTVVALCALAITGAPLEEEAVSVEEEAPPVEPAPPPPADDEPPEEEAVAPALELEVLPAAVPEDTVNDCEPSAEENCIESHAESESAPERIKTFR